MQVDPLTSSAPLTKRRPSGSSAREVSLLVWCRKVRRTAPSLTLKSLTILPVEAESACWLSGSALPGPSTDAGPP